MVIAYAAREGSTSADGAGGDSPYATSLARHLLEPGIDVRILFGEVHDDVLKATGGKQEPSDYDSIGGQGFYLVPPDTGAPAGQRTLTVVAQAGPAAPDARDMEMKFWEKVDPKDSAQLQAYLDQYPKGTFASLARAKLAGLAPKATSAAPPTVLARAKPSAPPVASQADLRRAAATEAVSSGVDAYRAKDFAGAMRYWRQAADLGNSAAQFHVGLLYARGEGVPQDWGEAMRWYQLAAAQGNSHAMNNIGNLHHYGRGVPQDYVEAMRWYLLAANKGSANGQFNLGILYALGHGVDQDPAQARAWFQKAAAQGDPDVQTWLNSHPLLRRAIGDVPPAT
jgi:TPR repeat protein